MAAWTEQPIHFIDFEGNRRSGILEYGVATLHGGRVVSTTTRLCAPLGRVMADETEVHGLSEADLRGQAPFSEDWELFCSLRASGPLAAHFCGTENGLLKSVWPYPRLSPDFARGGAQTADWGPWVDSAPLCEAFFPGAGSSRLEELIARFGLQTELDEQALAHCPPERRRYHAALYDALAGALLLCRFSREPSLAGLSLLQMLTLSTRDPNRREKLQQDSLF